MQVTVPASRARAIAFWIITVLVVQENVSGFFWALFRLEYVTSNLAYLGYPPYFLNVVGVGQLLCALAILAPGFERAKEWGYAGALLNYGAAAYSHSAVGDPAGKWIPALVYGVLTLASWALRPPERRLAPSGAHPSTRAWAVAAGALGLMTIVALFPLPKGQKPF
ncbi:MAG: DoxX family protein [Myxococcales bacterium]